jgi:hypothetical protein
MRVGSLVRHKDDGDIGVVVWIGAWKIIFVKPDGRKWNTYPFQVEVLCE